MNTCDTCTHWDRSPHGWVHKQTGHRGCKHDKLCYVTRDADGDGDKPTIESWKSLPDDGLGYYDIEDYNAVLATGPKFGCIHHEPIEAELWPTCVDCMVKIIDVDIGPPTGTCRVYDQHECTWRKRPLVK